MSDLVCGIEVNFLKLKHTYFIAKANKGLSLLFVFHCQSPIFMLKMVPK